MNKEGIKKAQEKRNTFFKKFHKTIVGTGGVTLSQIQYIRYFVIGFKKSKGYIVDNLTKLVELPGKRPNLRKRGLPYRKRSKRFYQDILAFIGKCSKKDWETITQLTEQDKDFVVLKNG